MRDVSYDMEGCLEVALLRAAHKTAHKTDEVGDVRSGVGKIDKTFNQLAIGS